MKKIKKTFFKTFVLVGLIATIPNSVLAYAEDGTVIFRVSDSEGTVGEDMRISITNDTGVDFSNGKFYLHYNNEVLNYKGVELLPSSAIAMDDVSVFNDEHGISYIVISIENVQNANVAFDFTIVAEGNPGVSLDVNELFDQNNEPVRFAVENGTVTVNPIVTEPETTTTTTETTVSTEKPSDNTTTTVNTEKPSDNTTTTVNTEKPSDNTTTTVNTEKLSDNTTTTVNTEKNSDNTTTTVNTEKPSDNTTTTVNTEKPSDNTTTTIDTEKPSDSTTTVKSDNNSNKNTATTTAKNSTSTGNNTTTKPTTTSSQGSNESPGTGDSFPALPLAVALGVSASIAVVTKKHNK